MTAARPPASALVRALDLLAAGVLALAVAQTVAFLPALSARWRLLLIAAAHWPFARALAHLYRASAAPPPLLSARRRLFASAISTLCLMPFAVFWRDCPAVGFFAANALLAAVAVAALLLACTRLARALAEDEMQVFHARAAGYAVLGFFGAIALALAVACWKSGLLFQPPEVLLAALARLPRSVLLVGVLPHLSCARALRRVRDGLIDRLSPTP